MSPGLGKCSKIRHIVRLRQMLRRWRNKARVSASRIPSDVPAGHVAVYVGTSCRRFVVRLTYLNHPVFKKLLIQAEEEYGFTNQGPLSIPCDETVFEEVIRFISRSDSGHSGVISICGPNLDRYFMGSLRKQFGNSGNSENKKETALILTRVFSLSSELARVNNSLYAVEASELAELRSWLLIHTESIMIAPEMHGDGRERWVSYPPSRPEFESEWEQRKKVSNRDIETIQLKSQEENKN
ncbi:hypothetical protein Gotri_022428, partial [Gossypium trilobum]|nr:hypothetical protein [Gossypium trilobum]